jgi:hypothetical protein
LQKALIRAEIRQAEADGVEPLSETYLYEKYKKDDHIRIRKRFIERFLLKDPMNLEHVDINYKDANLIKSVVEKNGMALKFANDD